MTITTNEQLHREIGSLTSQVQNMREDLAKSDESREALRRELRDGFHEIIEQQNAMIEKQNAMIERMDARIAMLERDLIAQRAEYRTLKWITAGLSGLMVTVIGWYAAK